MSDVHLLMQPDRLETGGSHRCCASSDPTTVYAAPSDGGPLSVLVRGTLFDMCPRRTASPFSQRPERVNDFAPPFVMNLLRKVVLIAGCGSPIAVD